MANGLTEELLQSMAPIRRDSKEYSSHKIVERRRRHRINSCISELSHVIPSSFVRSKHSSNTGKLEKAEVLELAVAYIHEIQRTGKDISLDTKKDDRVDANDNDVDDVTELEEIGKRRFEDGYKACMKEIARYLAEVEAMAPQDIRFLRLLCHLQNQNFEDVFKKEKSNLKPLVKPIRLLPKIGITRFEKSLNGHSEVALHHGRYDRSPISSPDTPSSDFETPSSEPPPLNSPPVRDRQVTTHFLAKQEPSDPPPCEAKRKRTSSGELKVVNVSSLTRFASPSPSPTRTTATSTMVNGSNSGRIALSPNGQTSNTCTSANSPTAVSSTNGNTSEDGRRQQPTTLLPVNVQTTPMGANGIQTAINSPVTANGIATNPSPQFLTILPHPFQHPPATKVLTGSKIVLDPVTGQYFLLPPTQCIQLPTHVHVAPQGANHILLNHPTAPGHIFPPPPPFNHVITASGHLLSTSTNHIASNGMLQSQCPNTLLAVAPTTSSAATINVPQSESVYSKFLNYGGHSPNSSSQESSYTTSPTTTVSSSYCSRILPGPPLSPTINPIQALENIAKKDPR
ncbi:uncharacterized protein LOC100366340 [Saccoglossus kowalevskii]|uniref:Uncharacterized protein PB18E9.04c-like n=1 Tax=Saccoglossus kowalevskii TaxID=10224 RepID=A0ABM0LXW7_SACKO|nr:PREDICTED: uncharacterized protein PB18E9.04c-like [Saccoglossus kowalevskii]